MVYKQLFFPNLRGHALNLSLKCLSFIFCLLSLSRAEVKKCLSVSSVWFRCWSYCHDLMKPLYVAKSGLLSFAPFIPLQNPNASENRPILRLNKEYRMFTRTHPLLMDLGVWPSCRVWNCCARTYFLKQRVADHRRWSLWTAPPAGKEKNVWTKG